MDHKDSEHYTGMSKNTPPSALKNNTDAVNPALAAPNVPGRTVPAQRSAMLMITCLCDGFFDSAARAAVEVLEHLGCTLSFPTDQTCCGQPAFNAGAWSDARRVVRHAVRVFRDDRPVVIPSSSCTAMVRHGAPLAFADEPDLSDILDLAQRTWELADYIVHGLGIQSWPGAYPARVAFHRSCHTRFSQSAEAAQQLLQSIEGLELMDVDESDQCCGFGGTFSISHPFVSTAMGKRKSDHLLENNPDCIAALDTGCLLHLGGFIEKRNPSVRRVHVVEILRDALTRKGVS